MSAPKEQSSKKPVSRFRTVINTQTKKPRDPRFDTLSGHFNQDLFEKSFSFLKDHRQQEITQLRQRIQEEKDIYAKEKLVKLLTSILSQQAANNKKKSDQSLVRQRRKLETELVKNGKKPFFLKRSDVKKEQLIHKYKASGDVAKALEKRRKHQSAKQRTRLPFKQRNEE